MMAATARDPRQETPATTHDRIALVTGGGSGIGLAVARELARSGYTTVICGRNAERLDGAARSIAGAVPIACDVSDAAQVEALVDDIERRFGRLDLLVNNAGMQRNYDFVNHGSVGRMVETEVALNLTALVTLTHAALPLMRVTSGSTIVNVGSGTGLMPKPDGLVYSATKAAVHSFSTGLRWELEEHGVRVVELFPPVVDTGMTAGRDEPKASPDSVAAALMEGLRRDRSEIYVGRMRLLPWLIRWTPGLAARILRKSEH